jgi:DNA-directed RNA polymerase beta' subunit
MRYLIIPPPGIRSKSDIEWPNELSKLYIEIIKVVKSATRKEKIAKITDLVSKIYGAKDSTGIIDLLSGKNGVFRKICFGKRINGSARSVITGDPCIDIDQVLIPRELADNLFVKCVIEENDTQYFIEKHIPLDPEQAIPGVQAIRRVRDEDLIFLNRQPTLSYGSLLTFRAKLRKDDIKTIGIHPNVTKTFNADFDGDEMNLFLFPYSSDLEKCHITNFPECIADIQDSKTSKYLNKDLDSYGLTVSLEDLVNKKYSGTGLAAMVESKAKGNSKNVEQIMHRVGDQYVGGVKIGTCHSSYVQGLTPDEFFIHQKAAREGVVSTGVSTSDTGYINRKGTRIMADVYLDDQGIVRDNYGIIDF